MYKLKIKKGSKVIVRVRGGFQREYIGGNEYTQTELKALHDAGHTSLVSKTKPKKNEEGI